VLSFSSSLTGKKDKEGGGGEGERETCRKGGGEKMKEAFLFSCHAHARGKEGGE